ncbi:MAG: glycerol-3-phosphate 1-O-acyltransferase PlsY [Bacteroidetes bacterium]|nr:glycerol-3-phosphate 1-O-acyltransferase PlsY [Bacteroidota bacterium]
MLVIRYCLLVVLAYVVGSVSNAVWIGKLFWGVDVREHGSRNAGANNVQRVLGWKTAVPVFVLDIAKGSLAVALVFLTKFDPETNPFVGFQIGLGCAALLGHILPLFAHFRGGKGVATLSGVILAIHPYAALICFTVFLICFFISRYISLSSIIAATCFPCLVNSMFALWLQPEETLTLKIFSLVVAVTIWITHAKNIGRLYRGVEEKFVLKRSPKGNLAFHTRLNG